VPGLSKTDAAIVRLEKALLAHPNDRDILQALASFHEARGDTAAAQKYAERFQESSGRGMSGR